MEDWVKFALGLAGVVLLAIFVMCYLFARKHGMDVQSLFGAAISVIFITAIAVWLCFNFDVTVAVCFWAPCAFISICPVLRDLATRNALGPRLWDSAPDMPWYGTTWFLWSGAIFLLGASASILFRRFRYN